jgi:apolipoprotein D and lipocalin family protein
MKILLFFSLLVAVSAFSVYGTPADNKPLPVVANVDLKQYSGKWYEIARYPNRFQRSCVGEVTAIYTVLPDREMQVENACRKSNGKIETAKGKARFAEKDGSTAKLEVRFAPSWLSWLPMVWGDYWVIDLDKDYSYSVVGTPDREYLWILSREPEMDEGTYRNILEKVAKLDFDTGKLVRTKQR